MYTLILKNETTGELIEVLTAVELEDVDTEHGRSMVLTSLRDAIETLQANTEATKQFRMRRRDRREKKDVS